MRISKYLGQQLLPDKAFAGDESLHYNYWWNCLCKLRQLEVLWIV